MYSYFKVFVSVGRKPEIRRELERMSDTRGVPDQNHRMLRVECDVVQTTFLPVITNSDVITLYAGALVTC